MDIRGVLYNEVVGSSPIRGSKKLKEIIMPGIIRLTDISQGTDEPPSPPIESSNNVYANNIKVVRVGDEYLLHPDTENEHDGRTASQGSPSVFVNNKKVHRANDLISCGDQANATGSPNVLANEPVEVVANTVIPLEPFSPYAMKKLVSTTSQRAPHDEPDELPDQPPPGDPPPPPVESNEDPAVEQAQPVTDCDSITLPIDYDFQLSTHYKLRHLSIGAVFKHKIVAQCSLTEADIVCNLKALAENCIEPILAQFPGLRINSGFRRSTRCVSQHEKGQACDIQWPSFSFDDYWAAGQWIKDNINYDQLLFEYGNSVWIHVSYNQAGNRPKNASNAVMTMKNGHYTSGLHKY